ncbi:MAG: hypothetical protein DYG90_00620 [Chloroflexi bacterium CFX6]|nr:hypothetical protein [Chloroflexi bacterium CFX6]
MPYGSPTGVVTRLSPHTVTLRRGAVTLAAQDCRIDLHAPSGEPSGAGGRPGAGITGRLGASVFGAPDLDIERGDQFVHEGLQYRVVQVEPVSRGQIDGPTYVRAYAEAAQS